MRELFYDMVDLSNQIGRPATCVYWILVRTVPPPVSCESYGVCITMLQTGEREEVLDITPCVQSESCPWHRCWRAGA